MQQDFLFILHVSWLHPDMQQGFQSCLTRLSLQPEYINIFITIHVCKYSVPQRWKIWKCR